MIREVVMPKEIKKLTNKSPESLTMKELETAMKWWTRVIRSIDGITIHETTDEYMEIIEEVFNYKPKPLDIEELTEEEHKIAEEELSEAFEEYFLRCSDIAYILEECYIAPHRETIYDTIISLLQPSKPNTNGRKGYKKIWEFYHDTLPITEEDLRERTHPIQWPEKLEKHRKKIIKALDKEITYKTDELVGLTNFILEFDGSIQVNAMRILMEREGEKLVAGPPIFTETIKYEVKYCDDLKSINITSDDDETISVMLPDTATFDDTVKLIRDTITEHEKEIHKI